MSPAFSCSQKWLICTSGIAQCMPPGHLSDILFPNLIQGAKERIIPLAPYEPQINLCQIEMWMVSMRTVVLVRWLLGKGTH